MIDFQQKKKINKFLYSKVTLVIFFIIIIFLAKATYNIYQKYKLNAENYDTVKKQYDSLNERKDMLNSEIERLKTDTGVEEEIRSRFNVAKPGETVVVVINGSSSGSSTSSQNKGFWASFWSIFK